MNRFGLIALLLAIVAILVMQVREPPKPPNISKTDADGADYWISGTRIDLFDAQGQRQYVLQAERLSHQAESGAHKIVEPRMKLHTENGDHWRIQAQSGYLNPAGDAIDFSGSVVMQRLTEATGDSPVLAISGPQITVLPEPGELKTDQTVTIRTPNSETHAKGMRAFTETERVLLLSKVRGRQLPNGK